MMIITINKNAKGVVDYYTKSLSKDDYFFTGGKNSVGYFHGKLVKDLGLPREVTKKAFSRLAHNRHPVTGEKLTPRDNKGRIASIEYTFSAPKSVSILMAMSNEEVRRDILNAHRYAVKKAMLEIENSINIKTWKNGVRAMDKTDGICYAHFVHFTSRPMQEKESDLAQYSSDPNLHSHCVVPNIGKFQNRFLALEGGGVHRSASYFEQVYHAHLSKRLADAKFTIQKTKDRWEIVSEGMTKRTLEKFSRRTLQVEEIAKKLGITDAKKKSKIGAYTRLRKSKEDENIDLQSLWRSKLTDKEYHAVMNPKRGETVSSGRITAKDAIDKSIAHHLERKSVVPVRKILALALKLGYGKLLPKDVHEELKRRDNIIYGETRYLDVMSTVENIRDEDKMLEWVVRGKGRFRPLNPTYEAKQDFLNDQQKQAIKTILSSADQLTILSGGAGTGKSTILREISDGIEEMGGRVVALAPSATASRDVLRDNGFKDAETIAMFLKNKDFQRQAEGQTILVDEAGLIGINTMLKLQDVARKKNARLILSGDTRQLQSVEAGDAMRLIAQKVEPKIACIDIIQRQKPNPKYLSAVAMIAKGEVKKGFDRLDKMNAVIEIEETAKRHDYIAKAYLKSIKQKRSALIIAPTNKECLMLNEKVRDVLKTDGRIKEADKRYTIQRNLSLTNAQKKESSQYEVGMNVQFFQNIKGGIKAGMRYEVVKNDLRNEIQIKDQKSQSVFTLPMDQTESFQVYRKDEIALSVGDKILITGNGKTIEKTRIYNGQDYKVTEIKRNGDIKLSSGKTLDKDFGHFNYAYCGTVHKAQGKTCDDVYLAIGAMSLPDVSEKSFYVGASRAKETIRIVTDEKDMLKETITRPGDRMSAKELVEQQRQKRKDKIRQSRRQTYYKEQLKNIEDYERRKEFGKNKLHKPLELNKDYENR